MPAKDTYHGAVKNALIKDGWTITHDPYTISFGQRDVYLDTGAERALGAIRQGERIGVEIKSFRSDSDLHDFQLAIGQYVFYRSLLRLLEPERRLFLAVPRQVAASTLLEPIVQPVVEELLIPFIVFDPEREEIVKWIRRIDTAKSSAN